MILIDLINFLLFYNSPSPATLCRSYQVKKGKFSSKRELVWQESCWCVGRDNCCWCCHHSRTFLFGKHLQSLPVFVLTYILIRGISKLGPLVEKYFTQNRSMMFHLRRKLVHKQNVNSGDKHCEFSHFYKLEVSYAIQHTSSKVILNDRLKKMTRLYIKKITNWFILCTLFRRVKILNRSMRTYLSLVCP